MNKEYLKINELEVGKIYDIVNNPFPNHILYFVDDDGNICVKDIIVKHKYKDNYIGYNDALKMVFIEI